VTVAAGTALFLTIACLHLAGFALPAACADAGDLFVKPAGSGSACSQAAPCTLASALAQALDGDTLYLAQGTYLGSGNGAVVTVTHSISLYCGWDGSTASPPVRNAATYVSVLDGEGQRRGIYTARGLQVTVDGCTVLRGNATSGDNPGRGGGIYIFDTVALLAHNVISGSLASGLAGQNGLGGGLYVDFANGSVLVDNWVEYNVAAAQGHGSGGGMAIHGSAGIVVRDNIVLHNTASITAGLGDGGGVYMSSNNNALVEHNRIESNIAQNGWYPDTPSEGGGLFLDYSTGVTVTGNTLRNNIASTLRVGTGGGISMDHIERTLVRGNLLQGNVACSGGGECSGYGGGLYAYHSPLVQVEANQFLDNVATQGSYGVGGALYLSRRSWFTLTNNIIAGNHASTRGGALTFEADVGAPVTATLLHNTLMNNNGDSEAGKTAIYINHAGVTLDMVNNILSGHSYGVYGHSDSTATLNRNLFYANTQGDTGGVNVVNSAPITGLDPLLNATYHLGTGSPAIDAGVPAGVNVDMDGDPRPMGLRVDIGADEYPAPAPLSLYLPVVLRKRAQ
jgi:hypothetical protein